METENVGKIASNIKDRLAKRIQEQLYVDEIAFADALHCTYILVNRGYSVSEAIDRTMESLLEYASEEFQVH